MQSATANAVPTVQRTQFFARSAIYTDISLFTGLMIASILLVTRHKEWHRRLTFIARSDGWTGLAPGLVGPP